MARCRLDGEADRLEPADELADIFSHPASSLLSAAVHRGDETEGRCSLAAWARSRGGSLSGASVYAPLLALAFLLNSDALYASLELKLLLLLTFGYRGHRCDRAS